MSLASLPNEILVLIASSVESETNLASFAQVNRHLYSTLISYLYRHNAKHSNGSALLYASREGNLPASEKALQAWLREKDSMELPASRYHKFTPLFLAAADNHLPIVQMLLAHGVDPNVTDRGGRTPLYMASIRGHVGVVEELLAHDQIKVNALESDGHTPICAAARNGHAEVVKMLLARGAHAGYVRRGAATPLHSAIRHKQPDLVRLLVNRDDVNPNARESKYTPLELAVNANREDLVEILLTDMRVNPDLTVSRLGRTPLLAAALKNNERMVQLLLDAGANKRIEDRSRLSPAMLLEAPSAEARFELIQKRSPLGPTPFNIPDFPSE